MRRLAALAALVVVTACGSSRGDDNAEEPTTTATAPTAITTAAARDLPESPLAQMVIAFEGDYTEVEIGGQLDRAFSLYGVPINDENYSRAGSALVALRQDTDTPEMEILSCAIASHVPGVNLSLPDALGLASALISATGGCE